MKTKSVLFAVAVLGVMAEPAAVAQTVSPAAVAGSPAATQPDQYIYAPRLPTPQELTDAGAARGTPVERIEQTSSQVTAVYRQPDGRLHTVAYVVLPLSSPGSAVATATTTPPPPVVVAPSTTVVYRPSRSVVYYNPYYDPWYPPVLFSVGIGLGHHYWYHHGWRQPYHGHHRFPHHRHR